MSRLAVSEAHLAGAGHQQGGVDGLPHAEGPESAAPGGAIEAQCGGPTGLES